MNCSISKIGFLGAGQIARAMAKGFFKNGLIKPEAVVASVHPSDKASYESNKALGIKTYTENAPLVQMSNVIFISVKPYVVPSVLSEIKPASDGKLFISVANGINLDVLERGLSSSARVIRVMPNTPSTVQSGCSVFARGSKATDEDAILTQSLMEAVGTCEEVEESLMNPITALSGSGPAYVFVMIEALADGAVRMGVPRDLAYRLASQTVMGSGQMVRDTGEHPGVLKDNVTSPSGSTAAGLKYLEEAGFRAAVSGAVETATQRCRQISEEFQK